MKQIVDPATKKGTQILAPFDDKTEYHNYDNCGIDVGADRRLLREFRRIAFQLTISYKLFIFPQVGDILQVFIALQDESQGFHESASLNPSAACPE
jgi:hypothetical protein